MGLELQSVATQCRFGCGYYIARLACNGCPAGTLRKWDDQQLAKICIFEPTQKYGGLVEP